MAALFRRKPAELPDVEEDETPVVTDPVIRPTKAYTAPKGEATPRRAAVGRRPEPPAADRKEALKRARERQRAERVEARRGMEAGEEKYLLPRDRGQIRALARDVVDSRRNAASFFFIGLLLVLVGSNKGFPVQVQIAANTLFFVLFAATAIDSVILDRKVKKLAAERFPKDTTGARGLFLYIVMRTLNFRRLRIPKPRVKIGDKV